MREREYERESATYYDKVAKHFNFTWDGFLASFFKRYIVRELSLSAGSRVLDVGCANGTLLAMLNRKTPIHGTGIDISPEMIKVASELHPEFDFAVGTAEALPFDSNSFDVLTCSASLHHFPDLPQFLREAKRVLKADGRLVIAEIRIPVYDVRKRYNAHIQQHSTEGDVKVYGAHELKAIFAENGWQLTKESARLQIQYYELTADGNEN